MQRGFAAATEGDDLEVPSCLHAGSGASLGLAIAQQLLIETEPYRGRQCVGAEFDRYYNDMECSVAFRRRR
jgi:hypothetical protein